MQKNKILHIITDLNTGGAEMMLFKILNHFSKKNKIESFVIVLMGRSSLSDKFESIGINIKYLNLKEERIPSFRALLKMYNYTKLFKPTIIQGWMYHSNLAALLLKLFLPNNVKIYWNIRQTLYNIKYEKNLSQLVIRILILFSKYINKIIYNSHISKNQHEKLGMDKSNSKIIYNGFEFNIYKPNPLSRKKIRAKYGIPDDAIVIGHIARYHPMKNHKMVIHLASTIINSNSKVWFLMVGKNVSKHNSELTSLMMNYKIKNRLLLIGEQLIIPEILTSFDIALCLSSWGEGFPNVIGEAMCSGLTVVATDVGDSKMIVGEYGSIIEPNNIINAVREINEYIDMDESKRNRLGLKGRDFIIKNFSIENIGTEYYQLYSLR